MSLQKMLKTTEKNIRKFIWYKLYY
jgi:hypothetical protein